MIFGPQRGPVSADELADHYPWPDRAGRAWVRAMMVSTLDGAGAGADGLSGSISGSADRDVFTAVRRYADAVLVGGGTMASERYGAMKAVSDDAERRAAQGQAEAPRLVVVSGSLDLPMGDDGFLGSTAAPLVLTGSGADPDRVAALEDRCEVVRAPDARVPPQWAIDQLVDRGLWRIVCEGGPTLLRDVSAAGLLDEADLTFSPRLVGTSATPNTDLITDPGAFELTHVLTADHFLMSRYVRASQ
ncbi:dihydrofolate reductase family protein [Aeromicrobium sp. CF3.5]|uniref:dihydrofolate reductase family protein n=1 Tax=Aeromicrobium sp. CF3.5 TaxID=3373078 RepID=UPI003EE4826F